MNVTYLIGNGFDLHLGLKTSFKDICDAYLLEQSEDEIIKDFKKTLKKDAPHYKQWSDFEIAMGKYSENFDDFEDYKKCVHDFRRFMVQYLQHEEKSYWEHINQYQTYYYHYGAFIRNVVNSIYLSPRNTVIEDLKIRGNIKETFISFNYTSVFKRFVEINNYNRDNNPDIYSNVIQLHGNLNGSIMFGVDNETQITNESFRDNKRLKRLFIKPFLNDEMERNKVNSAKNLISKSDVVCVYGMSFGDSDLTWKKEILNWLKSSSSNILVFFYYNDFKFEKYDSDDILNLEDDFKGKILELMGCTDNVDHIMEQIIVPVDSDLMDFNEYLEKNCQIKELQKTRMKTSL